MVWQRATCPELARSELVEIVEGSEVVSTSMVKILNPLFSHRGTEAQRFFHHEETRLRKAYSVACEGHEESHQVYFSPRFLLG
jgi:hypothetical protein